MHESKLFVMKKIFSLFFISAIISSIFFSCGKETTDVIYIKNQDTIFVRDTIYSYDTIFVFDSLFFTDTLVIIDTVVVYDTSEFAYLFKHYELEEYELIFSTYDRQKSPYRICKMKSNSFEVDIINQGVKTYPIWDEVDNFIFYVDFENLAIVRKDISDNPMADSVVSPIDRNMQFLWHDVPLEVFLFSYHENDFTKIAALDYNTGEIIELTEAGQNEANPVSSKSDDWIYYSSFQEGTWDIYRKKLDGSKAEVVYQDAEYDLVTFNVSVDGKFLITPKFKDGKGFVVFYDIKRQMIIHELDLPVNGHPLYASLSNDNKAIFFVNGDPYHYTEPRNIYRMALDGTQLFQLTNYNDFLTFRPLVK